MPMGNIHSRLEATPRPHIPSKFHLHAQADSLLLKSCKPPTPALHFLLGPVIRTGPQLLGSESCLSFPRRGLFAGLAGQLGCLWADPGHCTQGTLDRIPTSHSLVHLVLPFSGSPSSAPLVFEQDHVHTLGEGPAIHSLCRDCTGVQWCLENRL